MAWYWWWLIGAVIGAALSLYLFRPGVFKDAVAMYTLKSSIHPAWYLAAAYIVGLTVGIAIGLLA